MKQAKHVLVVDDEPELCELLGFAIEDLGHNVDTANSGNTAAKVLQEKSFDLVISDVRMPDGNGIDLLDQIRSLPEPAPKFILMTGYADITEQDAVEKGAFKLLTKPLNFDAFSALLEDLLG